MTSGFILQPHRVPRDSCELLVSWISTGSVWYDLWLCRLPPRPLKPTFQLASHSPYSHPHAANQSWREQGDGWRESRRKELGVGREWGNKGRWDKPSSSLSRPGAPVTPLTVRGWRLLAVAGTSDVWADISPRCSGWGQDFTYEAWYSSPQSRELEQHLSKITVRWENKH